MKTRKVIVEVICLVLLMFWFYEGVYKVAYWGSFSFYIKHAPLLRPVWKVLAYGIPIFEIGLALMFVFPKQRIKALYISIAALLVFVFWVMSAHLFTQRIFWPYHALWEKPTWMQKMLISMGLAWVALVAIVFEASKLKVNSTVLRNKPANAS